ncbi:MAG TPA: tRNA pseudouridine(55) synthase TruB, partial [Bacillales bacterium]|nr:tRNA pseudouridine(55) synthase TruB [Bacillales bacterium]
MDGILPLYKPNGMTSHDCVDKVRKLTRQRRIGHTGTLDPGAEGVLPLCLGKATKVVQYMSEDDKEYEAEITLGKATTTEDRFGDVISEKPVERPLEREEIIEALEKWTGSVEQIPPMYSAVKINGKRLYEYAREGIDVERPKRQVRIHELRLLDSGELSQKKQVSFRVRVRCSKGTYIRTLAVDIGQELGYPAHMSALLRTKSGNFSLADCWTLDQIEKMVEKRELEHQLFPIDQAISSLPKMTVNESVEAKV